MKLKDKVLNRTPRRKVWINIKVSLVRRTITWLQDNGYIIDSIDVDLLVDKCIDEV